MKINNPDYILIHTSLLDDVDIQNMPAEEFTKQFLAAINGEDNCFTKYIAEGEA